jgi:RNA recognition motif-containing protein
MVRIFVSGQNSNKPTSDPTIKQRQYGGPPRGWKGEPPLRGSELFVNNLPKDATLSELIPFFASFGRIYCLRLMMNVPGVNRGYCFVKYSNPREAYSVLKKLQGCELRPDHKIYAQISLDNSRLYFGQIPKSVTIKEFKIILETAVPGVKNIYMSQDFVNKSLNRGFAFAEFDSHKEALIAKTKLSRVGLKINSQPIIVGWSVPEKNSADQNLFAKVRKTALYKLIVIISNNSI